MKFLALLCFKHSRAWTLSVYCKKITNVLIYLKLQAADVEDGFVTSREICRSEDLNILKYRYVHKHFISSNSIDYKTTT